MISFISIKQLFLEKLLSVISSTNEPGTGCYYQLLTLRLMGVTVKGPVYFAPKSTFLNPKNLTLGSYVSFGLGTRIVSWKKVTIGDHFIASDFLVINDGGHQPDTLFPVLKEIKIGARVWCGTNVTICSGVTIGDDVIIGAGSVVVRSVPSNSVVAGVPAKQIKNIVRTSDKLWSLWLEKSHFYNADSAPRLKRIYHWLKARF